MTFFTNAAPTGAQPAFGLTQNGRAGMQMLGSIQKFSSTKMREAARTCFDESEAGQALIAEHRQGNAERAAVHDRVKRAKTIAYPDPMFQLERANGRATGGERVRLDVLILVAAVQLKEKQKHNENSQYIQNYNKN